MFSTGNTFGALGGVETPDKATIDTPRGSIASAPSEDGINGSSATPRDPSAEGTRDFTSKAVLARYHNTGPLGIHAAHNKDPLAVLAVTYQYGTDGH